MIYEALAGVALLSISIVGHQYAYQLARWSERLDSIGSTTEWDDVEPAFWKVLLYQIGGIIGAGVGAILLLMAVVSLL